MRTINDVKIDLKELKKEKERNFQERLKFIDWWADYMKKHKDKEWSEKLAKFTKVLPELQKQLPVDLSDVFSIIDAMPMRQREIRERSEYTLRGEGAESGIDVTSDERHEIAPANFVGAL